MPIGTKQDPSKYDGYSKAHPDEPLFTLLGRDKYAPTLVWLWSALKGLDDEQDPEKAREALEISGQMIKYQLANEIGTIGIGHAVLAGTMELIKAVNFKSRGMAEEIAKEQDNRPTSVEEMRLFMSALSFGSSAESPATVEAPAVVEKHAPATVSVTHHVSLSMARAARSILTEWKFRNSAGVRLLEGNENLWRDVYIAMVQQSGLDCEEMLESWKASGTPPGYDHVFMPVDPNDSGAHLVMMAKYESLSLLGSPGPDMEGAAIWQSDAIWQLIWEGMIEHFVSTYRGRDD